MKTFGTLLALAAAIGISGQLATAGAAEKRRLLATPNNPADGKSASFATSAGKLLKTFVYRGQTSVQDGDIIDPGFVHIFSAGNKVKCPRDTRCMIEVTVNVDYATLTAGIMAPLAVFGGNQEAGGGLVEFSKMQGMATWTFFRNAGPGTHKIEAGLACISGECRYVQHAVMIRLFKR